MAKAGRLHADHGEKIIRVWVVPVEGQNANEGTLGDYPSMTAARSAAKAHKAAGGGTRYRFEPLKYRVQEREMASPLIELLPDGKSEEVDL